MRRSLALGVVCALAMLGCQGGPGVELGMTAALSEPQTPAENGGLMTPAAQRARDHQRLLHGAPPPGYKGHRPLAGGDWSITNSNANDARDLGFISPDGGGLSYRLITYERTGSTTYTVKSYSSTDWSSPSTTPTQVWSYNVDSPVSGGTMAGYLPLGNGDQGFAVATTNGTVYVFDATDAASPHLSCSVSTGSTVNISGAYSSYDGTRVIVATENNKVTAYDNTCTQKAQATPHSGFSIHSMMAWQGHMWVGADDGFLYRLNYSDLSTYGAGTKLCSSSTCTASDALWATGYGLAAGGNGVDYWNQMAYVNVNNKVWGIRTDASYVDCVDTGSPATCEIDTSANLATSGGAINESQPLVDFWGETASTAAGQYEVIYAAYKGKVFQIPYSVAGGAGTGGTVTLGTPTGVFTHSSPTTTTTINSKTVSYPLTSPQGGSDVTGTNDYVYTGDGNGYLTRFLSGPGNTWSVAHAAIPSAGCASFLGDSILQTDGIMGDAVIIFSCATGASSSAIVELDGSSSF